MTAHTFYRELDHQHHYKPSPILAWCHPLLCLIHLPIYQKCWHHIFCLPIYFQYQPWLNMGGAYGKLQYWFTFVIKQLWSIEPAEYWVCLPLSTLYKWESSSGTKPPTKLVLFIEENSNVSLSISFILAYTYLLQFQFTFMRLSNASMYW